MSRIPDKNHHHHFHFNDWEKGFLLLILLVASFAFVYQVLLVFHYESLVWDIKVYEYMRSHQSKALTQVMKVFTFLGSAWTLVPAYILLIVYAFFKKRNKWVAIHIFIVSVSSLIMMLSLKLLFKRQRPDYSMIGEVYGMSFPSGHSYMSFTFFGLLIYYIHRSTIPVTWKLSAQFACLLIATIIALSRVYLGVHYFSDVVAGMCLGFIGLILTFFIMYQFQKVRR